MMVNHLHLEHHQNLKHFHLLHSPLDNDRIQLDNTKKQKRIIQRKMKRFNILQKLLLIIFSNGIEGHEFVSCLVENFLQRDNHE